MPTARGKGKLTRSLGALGLALIVLFGLRASTASASFEFHSEISPTTLTGTQLVPNEFEFAIGTTECEVTTMSGTLAAKTASEITLVPTYKECTTFGLESEVHMNGCAFVFTANGAFGNSTVHIECATGTKIQITAPNAAACTITIGAQMSTGEVHFQNGGAGTQRDISFTSTIGGISYSTEGKLCGKTEGSFGKYHGSVTIKGADKEGFQRGIWVV